MPVTSSTERQKPGTKYYCPMEDTKVNLHFVSNKENQLVIFKRSLNREGGKPPN